MHVVTAADWFAIARVGIHRSTTTRFSPTLDRIQFSSILSRVSLVDLKNYYRASFHLDFSSRKLDFSTPQVETIVKAGKIFSDVQRDLVPHWTEYSSRVS